MILCPNSTNLFQIKSSTPRNSFFTQHFGHVNKLNMSAFSENRIEFNLKRKPDWPSTLFTVLCRQLLGSSDCTRKSYIPPCRGKFALSESTVSQEGKFCHLPAILLKTGVSELGNESLNLHTECNCTSKRSCS